MSIDLECRCLGVDLDCECPEPATGEDGFCDGCRENDCMGRGRLKRIEDYREMAPRMIDPEYWLRKAARLDAAH